MKLPTGENTKDWVKNKTVYHKSQKSLHDFWDTENQKDFRVNQKTLHGQYTNPNRGRYDGSVKMAKLSEEAKNYVQPTTAKNITELEKVSVDVEILQKTVGEGEKAFTYKYLLEGEEEYRVPMSVIGQLKEQMEAKPDLKEFKVTKTGEGLKTVYTVITL